MVNLFMYCLGATAVLIQFIGIRKAFKSMNWFEIKKAIIDMFADSIVFLIAMNGGVGGFYIAIIASLAITVYLHFFTHVKKGMKEPWLWRTFKNITGMHGETEHS